MRRILTRAWSRFWALAGGVSIRFKIMGIVLLVVLALGVAVAWYVGSNVAASLKEELELRGKAIGRSLAAHATDLILTDDLFELYRVARDTLGADDDILYVYVEDPQGQVLVHTFDAGFPADLLRANRLRGDAARAVALDTDEGRLIDVAVPILGGEVGAVHVGLSTRTADAAIGKHVRFILLAMPLVLVPGLALAYLLATIIRRALGGVVRASDAVGRGDFTGLAPVWAGDEIGRLAAAFNRMTERLSLTHHQLLRRHRELSILNATARATSRSLTLEDVLKGALDNVCDLMATERGRLCLFEDDEGVMTFLYLHGPPSVLVREAPPAGVVCPCIDILTTRPYLEGGLPQGCPMTGGLGTGTPGGAGAGICLPLRAKERLRGILHLAGRDGRDFPGEDIQLLVAVSEQLAVAVENARLWEDLKEREEAKGRLLERVIEAQENERRRVAQELHDEAGQALTSLLVAIRSLELNGGGTVPTARVGELRSLVADSLETIQNIALELRPSALDDIGLVPALRRYVEEHAGPCGLRVDFHTSGLEAMRFEPAVETAVYRVVQEALTNVVRHAGASGVEVILTHRGGDLVVIVEDDGVGFDVAEANGRPDGCLGLRGMEERAALIGGRLTVESEPGGGTTVFVEVPLPGTGRAGGDGG